MSNGVGHPQPPPPGRPAGTARHLLEVDDLGAAAIDEVLRLADRAPDRTLMDTKGAVLLFQHPSARTRNAAEMAVASLGGHPVTVRADEVGIDIRETAEDVARTLACYHDVILARVSDHSTLRRFTAALDAGGWSVPVVNLLSDNGHPTQILADLCVIRRRFGSLAGRKVAWIGDGNNVCRSLVLAAAMVGVEVSVSTPPGFGLSDADVQRAAALGRAPSIADTPQDAVLDADVLYTDVWVSMGQEDEAESRRRAFAGWTIDAELVRRAAPDAVVMHCLPAHRGEEIAPDVLEGPRSVIWEQVVARRDSLVGLLSFLFGGRSAAVGGPRAR
ncbi:MAG: ornithine carbamoyltransferase [Actinomycetota bacterium]|nr:ornithine carbamoyltransferase [Actinomycetota bacterium]